MMRCNFRQIDIRQIYRGNVMRWKTLTVSMGILGMACVAPLFAQRGASAPAADDPVAILVKRLDLEKYKATLRGLAQFGDRRQGTERNRRAVDWIVAQLKSYGCTGVERIKYVCPTAACSANQNAQAAGRGDANAAGNRGG